MDTERLTFRALTMADLDDLVALDADPVVMAYLTNGVPTPRAEIETQLPGLIGEHERSGGLGRYAAIARDSGAFLGWMSLRADGDEADLGYRLRRSAWGYGYATEGARALVDAAFTRFGLRRVYARTMAVNARSRAVMVRAGLRYVRTFHLRFDDPIPGTEYGEVEYAVTRAEYRARSDKILVAQPSAPWSRSLRW